MAIPYEATGRREQKARTRAALVAATRELLAEGAMPTVEDAAARAGISRTTAYRYFPNQRSLFASTHPEIQQRSLLPDGAPDDPSIRLDLVMREFTRTTTQWEPELRTSLRLSLEPGAAQPQLRKGQAIVWIEDALSPLRDTHPGVDIHRLAVAIRSATGIESLVWLVDIAGLSRAEATELMSGTARALLRAALADEAEHQTTPAPSPNTAGRKGGGPA
ncbi:TetR/AcrR family transcriptional regulator [Micromonospora sp. NBC_01392]|uniref:TetR/AcrR family transcriptional regulator n=1 Tax=Micromonospora sp. NBC_01392 TaxID=2903588 RepID=UPI0032505673